jgi:hypothetical protein
LRPTAGDPTARATISTTRPAPRHRPAVGVEPLIDLLPVVGDAVGAVLAAYVLSVAVRTSVPRATLARAALVLWTDAPAPPVSARQAPSPTIWAGDSPTPFEW